MVNPGELDKVYFCAAFWHAPRRMGTDFKAVTLIHEASHFTANGGTEDYANGQDGAEEIARSKSGEAMMNADNHEYFAENDPVQS